MVVDGRNGKSRSIPYITIYLVTPLTEAISATTTDQNQSTFSVLPHQLHSTIMTTIIGNTVKHNGCTLIGRSKGNISVLYPIRTTFMARGSKSTKKSKVLYFRRRDQNKNIIRLLFLMLETYSVGYTDRF
jgi:hypothetical protein